MTTSPDRLFGRMLLLLATLALVAAACSGDDTDGGAVNLGTASPDTDGAPEPGGEPADEALAIEFDQLDGGTSTLGAFLADADRPVVLNFFASWCGPCRAEMPEFEEVSQELIDDVAFIGIGTQDRPENAEQLVAETGVTYAIGLDPDGSLNAAFRGLSMPTTVFITADGQVSDVRSGQISASQLTDLIEEHLLGAN